MHYVDSGKRMTGDELNDMMFIMNSLNICREYLYQKLNKDMTESQVKEYFQGIIEVFLEAKINEHLWRKDISDKYNVPYTFEVVKGTIVIDKDKE